MNQPSQRNTGDSRLTTHDSPALQLRQIRRSYGEGEGMLEILRGVNLSLVRGEMLALVAPSGTGKSTLLHIAGLLDTPQEGEILIAGEAANRASDAKRTALRNRHIGFIYQFHHLLPELTARENIILPQSIGGVPPARAKKRADALLERLGLGPRAEHIPAQLSGGEQQRVAIARALANHPSLLLADEPTGNLDPATSERVCDLLLEVAREEGTAALIATHNMALAKRLHRVVTLADGQLVPMLLGA